MTDEIFNRALYLLRAGNRENLKNYLTREGESLRTFADRAIAEDKIKSTLWEQIVGEPMPDPQVKAFEQRLNTQQVSFEELILKHSQSDYGEMINRYIHKQIDQSALNQEEVTAFFQAGIMDEIQLDLYCEKKGWSSRDFVPKDNMSIPPSVWPTDLDLSFGHTDILLVGAPGAGKTMFLSLFYHYAKRKLGNLDILSENPKGSKYSSIIIQAAEEGQFIDSTPKPVILNTSCNLTEKILDKGIFSSKVKEIEMPFNCIEISGENFSDSYGNPLDEWPEKLQNIFKSENPLILVVLLPLDEATITISELDHRIRISTEDFLNYIIGSLQQVPEINRRLVAASIVISKWDELKEPDKTVEEVVAERCPQMHQKLQRDFRDTYGLFPFSVGQVNKKLNSFQYQHDTISEWYDWLISIAPVSP